MLIRMHETRRGTEDGHRVQEYYEGKTYDVREMMGYHFVNKGWAVDVEREEYHAREREKKALEEISNVQERSRITAQSLAERSRGNTALRTNRARSAA